MALTQVPFLNILVKLLTTYALYPNFTQEEFDKEKAKLLEGIKAQEKNVTAIANRVVNASLRDETSRGEYTTLETLNVTLDDVKANYAAYFAPENAYLVIGDIKYKEVKPVVENFSAPETNKYS
jgi:predicted Zn-dependent peptidase